MKKSSIILLVAGVALIVGVVTAPQLVRLFSNERNTEQGPDLNLAQNQNRNQDRNRSKLILETEKNCIAGRGGCLAVNPKLSVQLRFRQTVYYLKPFPVEVLLSGPQRDRIRSLKITFHMPDMNMGTNKVALIKQAGSAADGSGTAQWRGQAFLPVCVTGRNDWLAVVEANGGSVDYEAVFPVIVKRLP